ncbi:MAG: hypothetical protein IT355_19320 [Gemmatimonadaceae bacterium]|nr:hypothetical protein [Gemmatimonadaceae bacterium]
MILTALAVGAAGLLLPRLLASIRSGLSLQRALDHDRTSRHGDLHLIGSYHREHALPRRPSVSDKTWADLDMDSVFGLVDHTESEIGRQYLYDALHRPCETAPDVESLDRVAAQFAKDARLTNRVRSSLRRLHDTRAAYLAPLLMGDVPDRPAFWWLFPILSASALASMALIAVWPQALVLWLAVCAANMCVQAFWKARVASFLSAVHELPAFVTVASELGDLELPESEAATRTLREGARTLSGLRTATRWLMFEPGPANELASMLYAYLNLLFLFDANAFVFSVGALQRHRTLTRALWEAIGAIDMAQSIAHWRTTRQSWCVPDLTGDAKALDVQAIVHPLLADPVANAFTLHQRGALITGSNMSGKTTFARALGVNALLGQTLATVCAESWRSPSLRVCTSIGREDSVLDGRSYYMAEVESILQLLQAKESGHAHLFLLDEIYRGTNTVERVAAASAVLHALNRGDDLVVVTTHDTELIGLLGDRFSVFNFREEVGVDGLVFDYRIRPGLGSTRNAIALLERVGYPADVVAAARAIVDSTLQAG